MFISTDTVRNIFNKMNGLNSRLHEVERRVTPVTEFMTGIMLDPNVCDKVELRHVAPKMPNGRVEVMMRVPNGTRIGDILMEAGRIAFGGNGGCGIAALAPKQYAYFRKGTAPKCDYIQCDGDKLTYWNHPKPVAKPKAKQVFPKLANV